MILYINVYFVCMDEKSRWPVWQEIFNIGPYGFSLVRVSKSTCAHGPLTNLVVFFCFRIFSEIMKLIEPKLYINVNLKPYSIIIVFLHKFIVVE